MRSCVQTLLILVTLLATRTLVAEDIVVNDFEAADYGTWKVTGEAFGLGPADGTLPGQMEVSGFQGKRLVNTFFKGDATTGTLTSPTFKVDRKCLTFLLGGGGHPGTYVNLLVGGKVVRTAAGPNTKPGGSERLERVFWDVAEFAGEMANIEIVDKETGGWGHINVDDIRLSDAKAGVPAEDLRQGPNLQTFASYADVGYDQPLRPQFHFTSRKNWLNDPNGMVYLDGEYHLFFQHNPLGTGWGNMTWGHAVSKDLVHWEQLPHAILPYDGGTIFSGTAAVDEHNTLGVQKGDTKTLVAMFSFAKEPFGQSLAYSTDRGRTFTLWNKGQPVIPNNGYDRGERDPKLFWHAPTKKWVLVLWVKQAKPGRVLFFNSDDLRTWKEVSQFNRDWVFECMDLVEMPVDRDPAKKKWLIYDASFEYEIGDFDGQTLTTDKKAHRGEYGPNYYAAQTFNNSPDGRTIIIGWMRGENAPFLAEKMPFNQQMSFPCTLELKTTADGLRLFRWPVNEIKKLYEESLSLTDIDIKTAREKLNGIQGELLDVWIQWTPAEKSEVTLHLRGQQVKYAGGAFHYAGHQIPAPAVDGKVALRVLVDRASVELFANGGAAAAAFYAKPVADNRDISLAGPDGLKLEVLQVHRLKSAWKE